MTSLSSKSANNESVEPPKQWPKEVVELYEPVRELGRGGFASVMLARRRKHKNSSEQQKPQPDNFVAMKVVGSEKVTTSEVGYAHREMDILRELSHPNIVNLIESWEPPPSSHICAAVMALSYAEGPTIKDLLEYGGALSLCFSRVVIAQVVDAVVYLHERAVIHRDIKPDNVVVSGASLAQDDIWDDDDGPPATKKEQERSKSVWARLRRKWHVTLLDFGFARALTPNDMEKTAAAAAAAAGATESKNSSLNDSTEVDKSISHLLKRQMSSVGNIQYAAPEIVCKTTIKNKDSTILDDTSTSVHITRTLSRFVANYSMTADAYSLGSMIRYILTGTPPDENNDDVVDIMESPIALICLWLCNNMSWKSTSKQKTRRKGFSYRRTRAIPTDLLRLVRGLTHPIPAQRTSVRAARYYPWIDLVLDDHFVPKEKDAIHYLECAMKDIAV